MAEHTHHPSSTQYERAARPLQRASGSLYIPASETAERMAIACVNFLETLTPDLRRQAEFAFEDGERHRWHYVPREMFERKGVPIKEMDDKQRKAAFDLLASGLSQSGYGKATAIIEVETTLGELERSMGIARLIRDPELYFFSVFGEPMNRKPWGWRVDGHHLSLHFTVVNRELIAPTPSFFGSNPAEVRQGPKKGLRILSAEEDLARQLLGSLNVDQKAKTIINATAPADIITRAVPKVEFGAAEGLAAESMTAGQREILVKLIQEYIDRLPDELARAEMQKLRHANVNDIHFAWAGPEQRGGPHYYRLHGPFFFVEYDNTQNDANHIHTVWRHLDDDFGLDLLRLHYRHGHHA